MRDSAGVLHSRQHGSGSILAGAYAFLYANGNDKSKILNYNLYSNQHTSVRCERSCYKSAKIEDLDTDIPAWKVIYPDEMSVAFNALPTARSSAMSK